MRIRIGSVPFVGLAGLLIAGLIVSFPEVSLEASVRGVRIWWDILFPALFPFFVVSEVLIGFGIVHFFGTLLDPMMRPLFRVPGIGGFVMAMGFASGYPVGARLTSQLWSQRLVGREEGERLVAFTSTADPIFLIGAVSVGFFHDVALAPIIAVSHYGSGVIVGLLMRFHAPSAPSTPGEVAPKHGSLWRRAFTAMHVARIRDGRMLGEIMQVAVRSSLMLVFVIGGLVVFFSVALELLTKANLMELLYSAVNGILGWLHVHPSLSEAVVNGIFEVTLGVKSAGEAAGSIPLIHKVAVGAFVLSWSGFSVHAQIASLLTHTNLRYRPFVVSRLIHGVLAACIVYIFWSPLSAAGAAFAGYIPAFAPMDGRMPFQPWMISLPFVSFLFPLAVVFLLYAAYRTARLLFSKL